MTATMTVTSRDIRGGLGANSVHLHRWAKAGLIRPARWNNNAHGGYVWPDWVWRMAALLQLPGAQGHAMRATMRQVAGVLEEHPAVPWVVIGEDGVAHACFSAAEVLAVHTSQTCSTTVVAVPEVTR